MTLHRAVLVRKDLHGVPGVVRDRVPLGGSYVVDMSRRGRAKLINGAWVEMVHVTNSAGIEGYAPLALYEIEEGVIQNA